MLSKKWLLSTAIFSVGSIILIACESQAKEVEVTRVVTRKETIVETVVETVVARETIVEKETVVETVMIEATAPLQESEGPRTLVICLGQEPDTLYTYGGSVWTSGSMVRSIPVPMVRCLADALTWANSPS